MAPVLLEERLNGLARAFAREVFLALREYTVEDLAKLDRDVRRRHVVRSTPNRSDSWRRRIGGWAARYKLTSAETSILRAAAEGMTHGEIAKSRGSSPTTIKAHVHHLLKKTGDRSMLAAVARLLRERGGDET